MKKLPLSRRGLQTYIVNPSIKTALDNIRTGVKRISNFEDKEMIISNSVTGEIVTNVNVGFHQRIKVDKTQFVKLYIQGVTAFIGLSRAGARVLEAVLIEVNKNIGKDIIYISPRIADTIYSIKRSTFMSGIRDLLSKEILYEHIDENWYFINVNFIFNGDRLAFLKTYEIDDNIIEQEHPNQAKLPFG